MHRQDNGWLTPEGGFVKAEPTPKGRIRGESLGGHERAALDYIEGHALHLVDALYRFRQSEAERLGLEFPTWEDTDGHDVIKRFAEANGCKRIASDEMDS